ncbi:hypothetical protein CCYN2B_110035 [Capnocytophaga cynodegmi]|uniref:Uncharacterized protein n=1 Tax=Capnocytophaga cynodegmi TaxID=28189 RepID=A0A0B7H2E1_9FLAO|nr:hypothetical protein CCYN2B_110035 [Capnocytophaga cynodegmi]CEN33721.1 hypothetical protein CCYN74_10112 [Capnocytophaga cynodegmi]CEN41992.1 hypothetical protein CCYN49044_60123 [Capnocytophaga cynodegmi]
MLKTRFLNNIIIFFVGLPLRIKLKYDYYAKSTTRYREQKCF